MRSIVLVIACAPCLNSAVADPAPRTGSGAKDGPSAQFEHDRQRLARRLQRLADRARKLKGTDRDKATVYGEMLATCAGCHAIKPVL